MEVANNILAAEVSERICVDHVAKLQSSDVGAESVCKLAPVESKVVASGVANG